MTRHGPYRAASPPPQTRRPLIWRWLGRWLCDGMGHVPHIVFDGHSAQCRRCGQRWSRHIQAWTGEPRWVADPTE